jgi:hypothetical protein
MRWPRELALACLLGFVLCSCHDGMHVRADAIGSAEDVGGQAPSEDALSASSARDAQIPDEAVREDSAPRDAGMPDAGLVLSPPTDGNLAFEVGLIRRDGTNFGVITVVVYSDASAVRTRKQAMMGLSEDAREPSIEVLPPGSPEAVKFLEDLALVDNVAALGGSDARCAGQSISFSTRTHLTAGGVTSRNLECNDGAVVSHPVLTADCIALAS